MWWLLIIVILILAYLYYDYWYLPSAASDSSAVDVNAPATSDGTTGVTTAPVVVTPAGVANMPVVVSPGSTSTDASGNTVTTPPVVQNLPVVVTPAVTANMPVVVQPKGAAPKTSAVGKAAKAAAKAASKGSKTPATMMTVNAGTAVGKSMPNYNRATHWALGGTQLFTTQKSTAANCAKQCNANARCLGFNLQTNGTCVGRTSVSGSSSNNGDAYMKIASLPA